MAVHLLSDVDVVAISLVDKGANRRQFFLRKRDDEGGEILEIPGPARLVKSQDWSSVYCVVAEPGWRENPGVGAMTDLEDEWASAEEIRRAAHRFMKNGGLVNKMHETLEPYGHVVENFVALQDMSIGEELIKEGAWVVAIEPNDEGKRAIETGEFTGVSIQGTGVRKLVEKVLGPPGTDIARNQAAARGPLRHLIAYYMKKPKPFTACVRDNTKRFGPERAQRVCAVLKDLGTGTTHWRHGSNKIAKAEDIPDSLVEEWAVTWGRAGLTKEDAESVLQSLEMAEGTLSSTVSDTADSSQGWLKAIAKNLGITREDVEKFEEIDDEKHEEETVGASTDERLTTIEESVTKSAEKVEALANRIADIAEALAGKKKEEEEQPPQPSQQEVYHRLDEVAKSLDDIRDDVDKIAKGTSAQRDGDNVGAIKKTDAHPLSGILLD
jgi:Putative phage serine protease XkdF